MSDRPPAWDGSGPPSWPTLELGETLERGVFGVQQVKRRSPRTGREGTYQILRIRDWANVVALTPEDEVVMVVQYRHGLDNLTLEIPGGVLEPDEPPALAAARELAEETGFTGDPPILIGTVHPNPAIQDNACTTWLITGARRTRELELDDGEDIEVVKIPRREIRSLLSTGRITHSLVVAAFLWLEMHAPQLPDGMLRR